MNKSLHPCVQIWHSCLFKNFAAVPIQLPELSITGNTVHYAGKKSRVQYFLTTSVLLVTHRLEYGNTSTSLYLQGIHG